MPQRLAVCGHAGGRTAWGKALQESSAPQTRGVGSVQKTRSLKTLQAEYNEKTYYFKDSCLPESAHLQLNHGLLSSFFLVKTPSHESSIAPTSPSPISSLLYYSHMSFISTPNIFYTLSFFLPGDFR